MFVCYYLTITTTAKQKAFSVIEHGKRQSPTAVQRALRTKYGVRPPDRWVYRTRWFKQITPDIIPCDLFVL